MNDVVNKHAATKDDDGLCSLSFNVAPQEASDPPSEPHASVRCIFAFVSFLDIVLVLQDRGISLFECCLDCGALQ